MNITKASIFVVDDDEAVRASLMRLIRSVGWSAEGYPSAEEFLARPPFEGTGCLLIDVNMPGISGPRLQQMMAEQAGALPVVFLTGAGDVPTCALAMKEGAVDFLLKPVDEEALLQALERALLRHARDREAGRRQALIRARLDRLTGREREVMNGVLRGRLNKQIGDELAIGEKTVKVHRARLMEKMEVRSVAELVQICGELATAGRYRSDDRFPPA
jgi:FixJ family two-component response regulator